MKLSIIKLGLFITLVALSGQILVNLNTISFSLDGVDISDTTIQIKKNIVSTPPTDYAIREAFQREKSESPATIIVANHSDSFLHDSDFWSLFRGEVPWSVRDRNLSKLKKIYLVISHCDKPLGWITNFTKGFNIEKTWVFSKCDKEVIDFPNGSIIHKLPNVGRCDHTYAHWMNKYLPQHQNSSIFEHEDVVVFMKDNHHQRERGMWGNRTFGELLGLTVTNGFGCMIPSNLMHKKLPKNTSVFFRYDLLRTFYFVNDAHIREPSRDTASEFKSEEYQNAGQWIDKLNLSSAVAVKQNLVPVCIGGVFAATMHQIQKQPRRIWEAIEKSLSRGDNIQEGHFAERFWASFLSKPLDKKNAAEIWKQKLQFRCRKPGRLALWSLCGTISLRS